MSVKKVLSPFIYLKVWLLGLRKFPKPYPFQNYNGLLPNQESYKTFLPRHLRCAKLLPEVGGALVKIDLSDCISSKNAIKKSII